MTTPSYLLSPLFFHSPLDLLLEDSIWVRLRGRFVVPDIDEVRRVALESHYWFPSPN